MLLPTQTGRFQVLKEGGVGHPRLQPGQPRLLRGNGRLQLLKTLLAPLFVPLAGFFILPLAQPLFF